MSIILKGIDLPNNGQIEIIIRPHGKVFSKTRGISAEAIQIPKDHGRIIDADKLESHEEFDGYGFTKSVYVDDIDDESTILGVEK